MTGVMERNAEELQPISGSGSPNKPRPKTKLAYPGEVQVFVPGIVGGERVRKT